MAGFGTGVVAVCSFFAGVSVVFIYEALRRKRESTTYGAADSESLNCRSFLLCGVGISLVTAAFGGLCCYVGYYTISDALDFRALPLGHLVLGYAAVNLAVWIFGLLHFSRQHKHQMRQNATRTA
jgi:drug/metabolite transporter (DMT)-like permease